MKGILFTEPLFHKVVSGEKTQARWIINPQPDFISENFHWAKKNNGDVILPRYGVGEKLYLKETYLICVDEYEKPSEVLYKHGESHETRGLLPWRNKLFMPASYRYRH
jgi:hypothetical protein